MHLQKTSTPDRVSALKLNVTEHKSIHFWTWNKPLLKLTDVLWEEHLKMVVKIKYLFMKVTAFKTSSQMFTCKCEMRLVCYVSMKQSGHRLCTRKTKEHSFRDSANEMFCDKAIEQIKPVWQALAQYTLHWGVLSGKLPACFPTAQGQALNTW